MSRVGHPHFGVTLARMAAPEPRDGTGAVPAVDTWSVQERRQGRHVYRTRDAWADILTRVHQSWIRRDRWWLAFPILLAVFCNWR